MHVQAESQETATRMQVEMRAMQAMMMKIYQQNKELEATQGGGKHQSPTSPMPQPQHQAGYSADYSVGYVADPFYAGAAGAHTAGSSGGGSSSKHSTSSSGGHHKHGISSSSAHHGSGHKRAW